jgi:hypothetical protein
MPSKQEIKEIDAVELTEAVGHWPAGAQGTVVSEGDGWKQIEMVGDRDDPLDLPLVPVTKLRLIAKYSD